MQNFINKALWKVATVWNYKYVWPDDRCIQRGSELKKRHLQLLIQLTSSPKHRSQLSTWSPSRRVSLWLRKHTVSERPWLYDNTIRLMWSYCCCCKQEGGDVNHLWSLFTYMVSSFGQFSYQLSLTDVPFLEMFPCVCETKQVLTLQTSQNTRCNIMYR